MKHRLLSFQGVAGLSVVRDGLFATTGKLSTLLDGICVPLRSGKFLAEVNSNPRVAAVVTTPELAEGLDSRLAVAIAADPDAAHSELHAALARQHEAEIKARPSRIDASAVIDSAARISPYGVEIGPRVHVGPNAAIAAGVHVEADCILHAGVVLGVPGFNVGVIGGRQRIVPQMGGVRLKQYVELLAHTCVARAVFGGETTIGEEVVADNLVYIAHDVQIGRRVQICALVNILGRTIVEDGAYIGPSAVIRNGLRIGAGARVSIGSVVTRDVEAGAIVSGNFAIEHDRFLSHLRSIR
jgi:UDP-3-O-[3-hydroxymyristoyl] glucosamine N-acyltransferase